MAGVMRPAGTPSDGDAGTGYCRGMRECCIVRTVWKCAQTIERACSAQGLSLTCLTCYGIELVIFWLWWGRGCWDRCVPGSTGKLSCCPWFYIRTKNWSLNKSLKNIGCKNLICFCPFREIIACDAVTEKRKIFCL